MCCGVLVSCRYGCLQHYLDFGAFSTSRGRRHQMGIYKKSSSGIINVHSKEWDRKDDSGIEKGKVGLKREEWDCVWIVGYHTDSGIGIGA